jgi:hypothetical protein
VRGPQVSDHLRLIDQHRLSNPTLDSRFWTLLADIIAPLDTQLQTAKSRPSKAWLKPILNRVPIAPILLTFMSLLPKLAKPERLLLTPMVRRCLVIIWPLCVQKIKPDTLLECFGGLLDLFKENGDFVEDENLTKTGEMITASFASAFGNASNKKKVRLHTHSFSLLRTFLYRCTKHLSKHTSSIGSSVSSIFILHLQHKEVSYQTFILPAPIYYSPSIYSTHCKLPALLYPHFPQALQRFSQLIHSKFFLPSRVCLHLSFNPYGKIVGRFSTNRQ